MTREETQKLLMAISSIYPNFKPEDKTLAVDSWHWALEEYPADAVKAALQIYIKTSKTGFAPSVSQLIDGIYKPVDTQILSEGEAWAMVRNAIRDGNYHSEERFDALPPLVQRAVGGAHMIRTWAMTDTTEINTVVMSNFQRTYRALCDKEREKVRIEPILEGMKLEAMNLKGIEAKNETRD